MDTKLNLFFLMSFLASPEHLTLPWVHPTDHKKKKKKVICMKTNGSLSRECGIQETQMCWKTMGYNQHLESTSEVDS